MSSIRHNAALLLVLLCLLGLLTPDFWEAGLASFPNAPAAITPVFSEPGGYYDHDLRLQLTAPQSETAIYYTLDGRIPTTTSGALYTQPLHLSAKEAAVTVVRARVIVPGEEPGPVITATYFMGVEATLPLVSLIVEPDDLWDEQTGIYTNPLEKGITWERTAVLTYLDKDRISGFQAPVGVRIHGGYSRTYDKKSFRLYFRGEYGQPWLNYPLYGEATGSRFKRLVLHSGAQDSPQPQINWSLLRNQIIIRTAASTNTYTTHSQPVLLFLNGQPWGIYQLRERIDERFLAAEYGIEAVELLDTPELKESRLRTDLPRENWDHLQEFVATHDLADPAHYAYVATQVDLANLIDYTIIQIYSANIDWPHRNMNMFRPLTPGGRWQWIFWDSDSSLGLEFWSQVDTDMVVRALAPDHPDTGGRDTLLLRKLMENADFRVRFWQRTADLLNTVLAPSAVIGHIDDLAAELEPNIIHESGRWQSTVPWAATMAELRLFAGARPDFVRQHMIDYFGLTGPFSLTINLPEVGNGQVMVNDWPVSGGRWSGTYFGETSVRVTAVPAADYQFVGWQEMEDAATITLSLDSDQTLTPQFAPIPAR